MSDETTVIERPETPHRCQIGWRTITVTQAEADARNATKPYLPSMPGTFIVDDEEHRDLPAGSRIQCECGRVWVKDYVGMIATRASIVQQLNSWHPERWYERLRRAWRQRRQ